MRKVDKSRNYEYTQKAAHCRKMRMRTAARRTAHHAHVRHTTQDRENQNGRKYS